MRGDLSKCVLTPALGGTLVPPTRPAHRPKRRHDGTNVLQSLADGRRRRTVSPAYVRSPARSIRHPGRETDAPLVAMAPWVSMGPSAHGLVTGEAVGLGRTALPSRR